MTECDKCGGEAVTFIRYSGAHLCGRHLCEFVEKRVKHEIRTQMDIRGGERVAVAVSGGKDSMVALRLIVEVLGDRRDLDICAVTVDEGIDGYRGPALPIVARGCEDMGIEHVVVSFEDLFGTTMDDLARRDRRLSACSYCGVLRRNAMNRAARGWGATHLATGLNLDDTAQSILMNFVKGDVERLARLGPHSKTQEGLVPRVQPLRSVPEKETTLYAILRKMEYHDLECPYAPEAQRNSFRELVNKLEDKYPGTRHGILRSYDGILPALRDMHAPAELGRCGCGEPTPSGTCKACELLRSLR